MKRPTDAPTENTRSSKAVRSNHVLAVDQPGFKWSDEHRCHVAARAFAKGELIANTVSPLAVQSAHNRPVNIACATCHAPLVSVSECLTLATGALQPADVIAPSALSAQRAGRCSRVAQLPDLSLPALEAASPPPRHPQSLNGEFFYCSEKCYTLAMIDRGAHLLCAQCSDEGHPCNQLKEMFCIDAIALAAQHFCAAVATAEASGTRSSMELARDVLEACTPLIAQQLDLLSWHEMQCDHFGWSGDGSQDEPSCSQLEALARRSWELLLQGMSMNRDARCSVGEAVIPYELYARVLASLEAGCIEHEVCPSQIVCYCRDLALLASSAVDSPLKYMDSIVKPIQTAALEELTPAVNALVDSLEDGGGEDKSEGEIARVQIADSASNCSSNGDHGHVTEYAQCTGGVEASETTSTGGSCQDNSDEQSFKGEMLRVLCATMHAELHGEVESRGGHDTPLQSDASVFENNAAENMNSPEFKALRLPMPEDAQKMAVAHVPGVLSDDEVSAIHKFSKSNCDRLEVNRKTGTDEWAVRYLQTGGLFRTAFPALVDRLIDVMQAVDRDHWNLLKDRDRANLSLRCVEYHHILPGGALADPRHFDTGSLLTLDILLSDSDDAFEGAEFQTLEADGSFATHRFGKSGDAVLFVSHKYHCVRPLRRGVRNVLVVELWEGDERVCGHRCNTHWGKCGWQRAAAPPVEVKGDADEESDQSEGHIGMDRESDEEDAALVIKDIAESAPEMFPPGYTLTAFFPVLAQLSVASKPSIFRTKKLDHQPNCAYSISFNGINVVANLCATQNIACGAPVVLEHEHGTVRGKTHGRSSSITPDSVR